MGVEKLDPPLLRITNPKSPTFDLYNNRFVVQNITQPPDLKLPEKSTAQKSQNERVARVWTNSLERLTILALRLTHLREGKSTVEEIRALAQVLFSNMTTSLLNSELLEISQIIEDNSQEVSAEYEYLINNALDVSDSKFTDTRTARLLEQNGFTKKDLDRWVNCVRAPTLFSAVQAMEGDSVQRRWPKFLILFTIRRSLNSRLEALELMRLFYQYYPTLDHISQTKFLFKVISRAQQYIPDILPDICQIFVDHSDKQVLRNEAIFNQLLWQLSSFGRTFTTAIDIDSGRSISREADIILQAQNTVVTKMKEADLDLDTKGYLALAHSLREVSPERARSLLDIIRTHDYPESVAEKAVFSGNLDSPDGDIRRRIHSTGNFPYLQGPTCLEILFSRNSDEALTALDNGIKWFESSNYSGPQYNFSQSSMLWATLLRQLNILGELSTDMTESFWTRIQESGVNVSPYLLSQIVTGLSSSSNRNVEPRHMLRQSLTSEFDTSSNGHQKAFSFLRDVVFKKYHSLGSPSLASKYIRLLADNVGKLDTHTNGLSMARDLVASMGTTAPQSCLNALLFSEVRNDPESVWKTYSRMLSYGHEPDNLTLYYLCRAAYDTSLMWSDTQTGTIYASQRAVVEFKHWVRGAHIDGGDSSDLLKVYPSLRLMFAYTVMCGRSKFEQELLEVLPWMERIGLQPDKPLLCALIAYSPNGPYLMKHGQAVNASFENSDDAIDQLRFGSKTHWPNPTEVEMFKNIQLRMKF